MMKSLKHMPRRTRVNARTLKIAMLLFTFSCAAPILGQSTQGAILGTVKDSAGAAIPNATVTLTNMAEGAIRTAISDASGNYQILDLKPGRYREDVAAANFNSYQATDLNLDARQQLRVDVPLQVGSVQQQVSVNAGDVGAITTESPSISAAYGADEVKNLPANYRASSNGTSPLYLIQTLPGVQADSSGGGSFSIQGGLPFQSDVTVDGITTKNALGGNTPLSNAFPSGESISELRVDGVLNNAEFGQPGEVTTVSKSGTNQLHGGIFYYHQNGAFNATPFGSLVKPKTIGNDFGGTVGGPVVIPHFYNGKDKTFFFGTYEGFRFPQQSTFQDYVPSTLMLQGNFSKQRDAMGNPVQLANPFSPGTVYPNATLPAINPASKAFLSLFPASPNVGDPTVFDGSSPNYIVNKDKTYQSNQFDVRGDQYLRSKALIFGRYTWKNISAVHPRDLALPSGDDIDQYRIFVLSANYNFTPHLINEFRFGFTLNNSGTTTSGFDGAAFTQGSGLQGLGPFRYNGITEFDFKQLTSEAGDRLDSISKSRSFEYIDNLTWNVAAHTMKFGLDIRRIQAVSPLGFQGADNYGTFNFTPATFTGQEFADFLLGAPSSTAYDAVKQDNDGRSTLYNFYAQDDWKFSPRLTLSYGVRYSYDPAYSDASENIGNFDPTVAKSGAVVYPDGASALLATGQLASANACTLGPGGTGSTVNGAPCMPVLSNSQAGLSGGLKNVPTLRFMPRLGFAFRPFNDDRTAIRGGFGMYNITLLGSNYYSLTGTLQSDTRNYGNQQTAAGPAFLFPAINAGGNGVSVNPPGTAYFGTANDINWKEPYSEQYSLSVDHAFDRGLGARLSYIGMETHQLVWAPNLNDYTYSTTPAYLRPLSEKPFPNWGTIQTRSTGANASYHSVQFEISRRLNNGLSFDSTYTFAKNLADNQGPQSNAGFASESGGARAEYAYSRALDFGNAYGTRRHRWQSTALWDLPVGRGRAFGGNMNRILDLAVGGWRLSNILLVQSGAFYTPYFDNGDPSGSGSGIGSFAALVGGVQQIYVGGGRDQHPDQVATARPQNQNAGSWVNKEAFVCPGTPGWQPGTACGIGAPPSDADPNPLPPIGRFGNAAVGSVIGPNLINLSSGLSKSFTIVEGVKLRAEGTFTNVLNHTNLGDPNLDITTANFGTITKSTGVDFGGNRTGQVSLRLDF